jgi:inosose dehydratase
MIGGPRVANAPCSYGAFEDTVDVQEDLPSPVAILDHIAASGYDGTDLGPVGWLGEGRELADGLAARTLQLAGGFLAMPFAQPDAIGEALRQLNRLLDIFDVVTGITAQPLRPKPTLADAGSPLRLANPGRAQWDRTLGLDDPGWRRLADAVARASDRCRERGFEPTFHHHTTSHVEASWEIDRLLELTDVGLCLDTGHLLVGGGDPVAAIRAWGSRINHIHIKDCHTQVVQAIVSEGAPSAEIWRRHAFCRLGAGDLDIDGLLGGIRDIGFTGWVVVEQDGILDDAWPAERAFRDQVENRQFLHARGL